MERASRASARSAASGAGIVDDDVFDVLQFFAEVIFQAFFQPLFDLPHALAADAVTLADLAQRERLFVQQALAKDDEIFVFETARELLDLLAEDLSVDRKSTRLNSSHVAFS